MNGLCVFSQSSASVEESESKANEESSSASEHQDTRHSQAVFEKRRAAKRPRAWSDLHGAGTRGNDVAEASDDVDDQQSTASSDIDMNVEQSQQTSSVDQAQPMEVDSEPVTHSTDATPAESAAGAADVAAKLHNSSTQLGLRVTVNPVSCFARLCTA